MPRKTSDQGEDVGGGAHGEPRLARRWRSGNLGRHVMVATADLDGDGQMEVVAAAGREYKVFDWQQGTFVVIAAGQAPQDILSLTAGCLQSDDRPEILMGTRDQILVYAPSESGLTMLYQSLLYPQAYFRKVSVGDVNGDGKLEIIGAASGAQTLYFFGLWTLQDRSRRLEELGRVYLGGLVDVEGSGSEGQVVAGTTEGYVDVYVPTALLPREGETLYTVRRGDSLWRVARRFRVSVQALVDANDLQHPYRLDPGQALVIPAGRRDTS